MALPTPAMRYAVPRRTRNHVRERVLRLISASPSEYETPERGWSMGELERTPMKVGG